MRRRLLLALAGTVALASVIGAAVQPTEAAWVDGEYGTSGFAAGVVQPATNPQCAKASLTTVRFSWANATGGLTRTGYRWELRQPDLLGLLRTTATGTLAPGATSVQPQINLTALGTGEFRLYAVHRPAGSTVDWESVALVDNLTVVTALLVNC
ncbi:hypothetical protein GCM10022377_08660 [Zhihengliuella alba]|uniref:Secreted protein n=1 Tax=Zhihengliuella alba TaxID=547018 RepID=A0ABP7D196_9MICC